MITTSWYSEHAEATKRISAELVDTEKCQEGQNDEIIETAV